MKNLTVGKRIALGFSLILVGLVVVGLVAYQELNNASEGFVSYRHLARDTNLAGQVQENILMARMHVKNYIIAGNDKDLQELGLVLGKVEPDKSMKIIARKPNVAFYAGLDALMFPEHVRSVGELVDFCRKEDVKYILYSGIEISLRPHVKDLLKIDQNIPGLEKVYHNRFGVIYRVLEE